MRRKLLKSPLRSELVSASTCKPPGHALHFGIEHQADAAHGLTDALRRVPAVLLVVVENDAGRENDQRQRGSRDQKGETHWQ